MLNHVSIHRRPPLAACCVRIRPVTWHPHVFYGGEDTTHKKQLGIRGEKMPKCRGRPDEMENMNDIEGKKGCAISSCFDLLDQW